MSTPRWSRRVVTGTSIIRNVPPPSTTESASPSSYHEDDTASSLKMFGRASLNITPPPQVPQVVQVFAPGFPFLPHRLSHPRSSPITEPPLPSAERSSQSAKLDRSYLESLKCVPDQDFLKTFLGLLVGRCSISSDGLGTDDAMLMGITKMDLEQRLNEMHPILKFDPYIDVHQPSFLEFLQNSARSSQYHVSKIAGTRRYLGLMTQSLIGHATKLAKQPNFHGVGHFSPEFGKLINRNPQAIKLDVEDWDQILHPLLNALKRLLVPSNIDSLMDGYCQQCRFFHIIHDTLTHFKSLHKMEDPDVAKCLESLEEIIRYGDLGQKDFDVNFGRVIFGSAAIVGSVMAILIHRR